MPRWKQQLGGLLIAVLGASGIGWSWYTALYRGYFYPKASMLFPAFLVLGLGLMMFRGYREERLSRGEDIDRLQGLQLITPHWWTILAIALVAAGLNYLLLLYL